MKIDPIQPLSHPVLPPTPIEKAQDQEKQSNTPPQPLASPISVAPQIAKTILSTAAVETVLPHWYSDLTMTNLLKRLWKILDKKKLRPEYSVR